MDKWISEQVKLQVELQVELKWNVVTFEVG
jgi:hypothetical protein